MDVIFPVASLIFASMSLAFSLRVHCQFMEASRDRDQRDGIEHRIIWFWRVDEFLTQGYSQQICLPTFNPLTWIDFLLNLLRPELIRLKPLEAAYVISSEESA